MLLPVHDIRDALGRRHFAMLSKVLLGTVEQSQIWGGRLGLVSTGSLYHEREDRQVYQNLFGQQNRDRSTHKLLLTDAFEVRLE